MPHGGSQPRHFGGGASNIGWATSTDGGATWTHGYLPGITSNGGGTFGQASDAPARVPIDAVTRQPTQHGT